MMRNWESGATGRHEVTLSSFLRRKSLLMAQLQSSQNNVSPLEGRINIYPGDSSTRSDVCVTEEDNKPLVHVWLTILVLDTDAKHSQDVGRLEAPHGFNLLVEDWSHLPDYKDNVHVKSKSEHHGCRSEVTTCLLHDLIFKHYYRLWTGVRRVDVSLDGHGEAAVLSFVNLGGRRRHEGLLLILVLQLVWFDHSDDFISGAGPTHYKNTVTTSCWRSVHHWSPPHPDVQSLQYLNMSVNEMRGWHHVSVAAAAHSEDCIDTFPIRSTVNERTSLQLKEIHLPVL